MGCVRPATPGFLVTLIATGLLAVVSFNTPLLKSLYFLKASVKTDKLDIAVTFGTLGYCIETGGGTQTCTKPAVGYELDINALVGNSLPIQIPAVLVKWVTYALVLHIIGLVLAGISAVFGLLAHVREMSMTYCSTCMSGFSAAVCLLAFVFDLVLFFVAKGRINSVEGGSAEIGLSIWLTLAAWLLLFFAGCFYGLGRCCISRRPRWNAPKDGGAQDGGYADQMRLDAIKAEADRKARVKMGKQEIGLPAFQEYENQPLTKTPDETYVDDGNRIVPYSSVASPPRQQTPQQRTYAPSGYSQGVPGQRAVDAYYNQSSTPAPTGYPPSARRQGSTSTFTGGTSTYAPSTMDSYNTPAVPPVPMGAAAGGYLAANTGYGHYGHKQQTTGLSDTGYGHQPRGTSYHSAVSHQQYGSDYSSADPFARSQSTHVPQFNADTYNNTGYMYPGLAAAAGANGGTNPYRGSTATPTYPPAIPPPDRQYTLGGGGYGENTVPEASSSNYMAPFSASPVMPSPHSPVLAVNTTSPPPAGARSGPASPRGPRPPSQPPIPEYGGESDGGEGSYTDSPPTYEAGPAQPPGQWGAKR